MSRIELKPRIFIEGFDEEYQYRQRLYGNTGINNSVELLYKGRTLEMPKKLAANCVTPPLTTEGYFMYIDYTEKTLGFETVKESIKSACPQKYCIIYKIK